MENQYTLSSSALGDLRRFQTIAMIVGIIGLLLSVVGWVVSPQQFYRSYLVAFLFWLGMGLGCLCLLMIQYMSGGAWGVIVRRIVESGSRTIKIMWVLIIPILIGIQSLFIWARPGADKDPIIKAKASLLNVPFFLGRAALYFAIWGVLTYLLNKWSLQQDTDNDLAIAKKLEKLSGPGLVIFTFVGTFAALDWIMSLSPHWFSTIYGLLVMVGNALSAICFTVAIVVLLAQKEPLSHIITKRHLHDLGKLMLALTMLWAYLAFSQLILIWSGNLPEEITYYIDRLNGGWQWIGALLLVGHFAFPFLLLLSQKLKRNPKTIYKIALYIIVIRLVDVFWLVQPNFIGGHLVIHWLDIVAPIGIGGLWLAYFFYNLRQRPIIPINAPDLQKALNHGRHHH